MAELTMTPFFSLSTATDLLAQQLKNHVWERFNYALTQSDVEDFVFTDMWNSIEEFMDYMQQVPSRTNHKIPPTAQIYTSEELDAMDTAILPLDYGLCDRSMIEMNLDTSLLSEDDGYDSDVASVFTDYDGEPLPLYDSEKLPIYRYPSPPPSYHSHFTEEFDFNPVIETPKYFSDPPRTITEEAKLESRRYNLFSKVRPRITANIKKLRDKIYPMKKKPIIKKAPLKASSEFFAKRVPGAQKLVDSLRAMSPKRAIKRARRFVTLDRC
ncbi:hypothetical protein E0Z10_g6851 [Xylaria hypoxylon]|uniref:Uncharacterized protein n=1 Tax=Xylaria hypoxylon TaxID=37992 RepID=A0A4Z0YTZ0_9PEZI|nr:hypothetical protein E0Z10_g6851 [Xylaria hypoxylon]